MVSGGARLVDMETKHVRKEPHPGHPITVGPASGRVVVTVGGEIVADSRSALTLREADYPAVQYVPRSDVKMELLQRSDHTTYCPYKGYASYFDLTVNDSRSKDAIWTYEDPFPAVRQIKNHVAFYPESVDRIEVI
jgi:uncharacterized protein (DUF427 family)